MTIKSMTGFARAEGASGATSWHWEIRSVNGRGLDVRLRVAPGYEALEPRIRDALAKRLGRGSVSVTLNVKRAEGTTAIRLNEPALKDVLGAVDRLRSLRADVPAPDAATLLGIRGVLEFAEPVETETETEARTAAMLAGLDAALTELVRARAAEGARLAAILKDQLAAIERLVTAVATSPARAPEAIQARLKEQVARLLDSSTTFEPARLYQEAALLAARADIEEEVQRLGAHIAAARELIASGEPVGRRLDFLAQEFNREANTVCSKSNDADMTRAGLELKAVIDQMREQVQNIE